MSVSRELSRPWAGLGAGATHAQISMADGGKFKLHLNTEILSAALWLDEQGLETLMLMCGAELAKYRIDRDREHYRKRKAVS